MATAAQLAKALKKSEMAIIAKNANPNSPARAEALENLEKTKKNMAFSGVKKWQKAAKLAFLLLFAAAGSSAQTPNREGQKIEQKQQVKKDVCFGSVATTAYHTGRNGDTFRIFVSKTGRAFIVRTSKEGKKYRDYSPKACKALNVADWVTK